MGAAMGAASRGMSATLSRAVFGYERRRWNSGYLKAGDGYCDVSGFGNKLDLAQAENISRQKQASMDGLFINECSIGGIAIAHEKLIGCDHNFTMEAGNGRMFDLKIACGTSP